MPTSIHFFDSIVVIEKGAHLEPEHRLSGTPSFVGGLGQSPGRPLCDIAYRMKWRAARLLRVGFACPS